MHRNSSKDGFDQEQRVRFGDFPDLHAELALATFPTGVTVLQLTTTEDEN